LDDDVSVIDTATNQLAGPDIAAGAAPIAIAIVPNQPPVAELSAPARATVGEPVTFDASASSDDEGIVGYSYAFGDGDAAPDAGPTRTHAYTDPGTYEAEVTVDDGEGCPGLIFTGQTASCNGPSTDTATAEVGVAEPGAFSLRLALERPQTSLRRITATATCVGTDCRAHVGGRLRVLGSGRGPRAFDLIAAIAELAAGEPTQLAPRIPAAARAAARGALAGGGTVRAWVRFKATAGIRERVRKQRVRLKP
jgi:plastocyanin